MTTTTQNDPKFSKLTLEFAEHAKVKPENAWKTMSLLGFDGVCTRCHGGGKYSYCASHGNVCFGCSGTGKAPVKMTRANVDAAKAMVDSGELVTRRVALKARKEAAKHLFSMSLMLERFLRNAIYQMPHVDTWRESASHPVMKASAAMRVAYKAADAEVFYAKKPGGDATMALAACVEFAALVAREYDAYIAAGHPTRSQVDGQL